MPLRLKKEHVLAYQALRAEKDEAKRLENPPIAPIRDTLTHKWVGIENIDIPEWKELFYLVECRDPATFAQTQGSCTTFNLERKKKS